MIDTPSDQLPPEWRTEAQPLREHDRMEKTNKEDKDREAAEIERTRDKKPEKPYVYPEIEPSLFQPVEDSTIKACLGVLYWSFSPNYKPLIIQSLLQNKLVRSKLVTTLLFILRCPFGSDLFPKIITYFQSSRNPDS